MVAKIVRVQERGSDERERWGSMGDKEGEREEMRMEKKK